VAREPLRPGERPFGEEDKDPRLVERAKQGGLVKGRPSLSQPAVGATDEAEEAWARRQHLGELRRQRKTEAEVFSAARRGEKVEVDDPALQEVAEIGEQFRRGDRRTAFMTGVGQGLHALGRAMSSANVGGSRRTVSGAARNMKRVPSVRRRTMGGSSALTRAAKRKF
jgi:hypothetical protein